jgi:hypothetical protein
MAVSVNLATHLTKNAAGIEAAFVYYIEKYNTILTIYIIHHII